MKLIILDCREIFAREDLHRRLAEGFDFPEWYGNNLDALHDCLTSMQEEAEIRLSHCDVLEARLGAYWPRFLRALKHSKEENPRLKLVYLKDEEEAPAEE